MIPHRGDRNRIRASFVALHSLVAAVQILRGNHQALHFDLFQITCQMEAERSGFVATDHTRRLRFAAGYPMTESLRSHPPRRLGLTPVELIPQHVAVRVDVYAHGHYFGFAFAIAFRFSRCLIIH